MAKSDIRKSYREIFDRFCEKSFGDEFTLESITTIFDIGNDVFYKGHEEEIERIAKRPPSNAPDIMDDEPYSFDRTLAIYEKLSPTYTSITPELIQHVYEINNNLAWVTYKQRYFSYINEIYDQHPNDEYINYLAAVMFLETKDYTNALKCINLAISQNGSSSHYTHIKGLILMQMGEYESARTYLYQALFLIELLQDVPPRLKGSPEVYPNYPIEYHTSADLVRMDLNKIDNVEAFYDYHILPLVEGMSV
jgi:tetratricopeptide (TPR) repeat protein